MTADKFDATLTGFQQRAQFRPFTVVLTSGTRFEIDHPGVGPGGVPTIFDHEGVEHFVADLAGAGHVALIDRSTYLDKQLAPRHCDRSAAEHGTLLYDPHLHHAASG